MSHTELRETVEEAVKGITERYDWRYFLAKAREGGYADEMWQAVAEQGLLGLGVPEEYGGAGGGLTGPVAVMEALSSAGMPPLLYALTCFSRVPIIHHGSDEQRKRFVAPTVTGESKICFAITEPDAGTNTFRMTTLAGRTADGYVINGQKIFISGADEADHMALVVRTSALKDVADKRDGLSLFMVDMDTPGIELQKLDIDINAPERQYIVHLTDVEVPTENLIGEEGKGFHYLFDALNPERLLISAMCVGIGQHAIDKATTYVRDRAPFGTPIGAYQAVQHPLARAKAHLDAARLMVYEAAAVFDDGGDAGVAANTAKYLASEAGVDAVDAAIQAHGGYAFDEGYGVTTLWPMARLLKIAPLNNEMILNYLAERVLRLPRSY